MYLHIYVSIIYICTPKTLKYQYLPIICSNYNFNGCKMSWLIPHETGEFPSTPHGAAVASAWVGVERPPAGYSSHASRRLGRAEDGLIDADRC